GVAIKPATAAATMLRLKDWRRVIANEQRPYQATMRPPSRPASYRCPVSVLRECGQRRKRQNKRQVDKPFQHLVSPGKSIRLGPAARLYFAQKRLNSTTESGEL